MGKITLNLPDSLKGYLDKRASEKGLSGPDAYVRRLIEDDQKRKAERERKLADLKREIAIGIDQANRGEVKPFDVHEVIAEGRRRYAERKP